MGEREPQFGIRGRNCVGWAKSAVQRRLASLARDFAHASVHIQRVGNGAPDFELATDASARRLPTLPLPSERTAYRGVHVRLSSPAGERSRADGWCRQAARETIKGSRRQDGEHRAGARKFLQGFDPGFRKPDTA